MNPANIRLLCRQISCLFNRYELNQLVLDQETISKIKKLAEKLAAEHESYFNEELMEMILMKFDPQYIGPLTKELFELEKKTWTFVIDTFIFIYI